MRRLKAIIFVDADVTIRHFLLNDTFERLMAEHDCVFVLPPEGWRRIVNGREMIPERFKVCTLELPDDRRLLWKRLVAIDQMRLPTRLDKYRLWKMRFEYQGLKPGLFHAFLALPGIRGVAERVLRRRLKSAPPRRLDALLAHENPDILIHPSTFEGYFINDIVEAGKSLGVPTLLVMNSWDNPSLKRAAAGTPDWIAVWGEQTRRHCIDMMRARSEQVRILGAAQFDVFREPPTISPADFRAEYGLRADAKVVLYAGSSKRLSEADHLHALDAAISNGTLPPTKIVYRPHPYGMRRETAQEILGARWMHVHIESTMKDFIVRISEDRHSGFHITDYRRTHDILSSIDALISPLSTMLIESAVHGKPALCYHPIAEETGNPGIWTAQLRHFEELFDMELLLVARSSKTFVPAVAALLEQAADTHHGESLKDMVKFFVSQPKERYSRALADFVVEIARPSAQKAH